MTYIIFLLFATASGCLVSAPSPTDEERAKADFSSQSQKNPIHLIAGTYTGAGSSGVYGFSFDSAGHAFVPTGILATIDNPSFGASGRGGHRWYFVKEVEKGRLITLQNSNTKLDFVTAGNISTEGAYPCYLALSPDAQYLAVANYGSGNIAIFRLDAYGTPMPNPEVRQHQGRGPNTARQDGPHAHWAQWSPEGDYLYSIDLGADRVVGYRFDTNAGQLGEAFTALQTKPGAGPRHMVFHPRGDLGYIINELTNQVVVARRQSDGTLDEIMTVSTLPENFQGASQAAHIAINQSGTRLYVSNRGDDSIGVFAISPDGSLSLLQHITSGGHWPRFFLLLEGEGTLLVANEKSDTIVPFRLNENGLLAEEGKPMSISRPAFIGRQF